MDTYILKNFLIIFETLNFTKAAEIINIVQPALSRQIQQLEESLGFQLFERHNRKVELTAAGLYFKNEVERWLAHFENLKEASKDIAENKAGHLRIGHSSSAMHSVLPQYLKKLKKDFPNLKITLFVSSSLKPLCPYVVKKPLYPPYLRG